MKIDELQIAKDKAEDLLDHINKYSLSDLQAIGNGFDLQEVLIYEVIDLLNEHIEKLQEKKEYEVHFRLSNGGVASSKFKCLNKKDVIKSWENWTCLPKERITSIELI
tara:strand:+ start:406 stop:729 length:324 start_codon:yes stop_codon:yes gene_type:complete